METSNKYKYYTVIVLACAYCLNFVDRQILSILQIPIKTEFQLTDTQLGVLTGLSFALFYSLLGVPIARLADRLNRVNIVSTSVFTWSLMTALCGISTGYYNLALFRVGVGVGEAGGTPPSHSIISDYFSKTERSKAIAIFSLGQAIGAALGVGIGGYVAQHYGWRNAFFIVGLPGIILALLIKLTVKEPVRIKDDSMVKIAEKQNSLQAVISLMKQPVFFSTMAGNVIAVLVGYSVITWLPPFLARTYSLTHSKVGLIVASIYVLGGGLGLVFGGFLGDSLAKRFGLKWLAILPAIAVTCSTPLLLFAFNSSTLHVTAILLGLGIFAWQVNFAPGFSLIQTSVAPNKRALASATTLLFSNLIGLGLGPMVVGMISDKFKSLSFALSLITVLLLVSTLVFLRAAKIVENSDLNKNL